MKANKTSCLILGLSILGYGILSVSFLLMPLRSVGILPGLMFWGGLLLGAVMQVVLELRRRQFFRTYHVKRQKMQKPHNGFLTFFSNRPAKAADCSLILSVVGLAAALVVTGGRAYICYVLIGAAVFSLCMHCVLNGRNCFHALNQEKIRRVLEQKKVSN